jgi:hypothetical protein
VVEHPTQLDGVVVIESAVQRPDQIGDLVAHPAFGQLGQHGRVPLSRDEGLDHGPAGLGHRRRRHHPELYDGVLEGLLDPLDLRGAHLDELLAIPGGLPQRPDPRWRHEAGRQQPDLEQLAQPDRILDVGLTTRDLLDVPGVAQQQLLEGLVFFEHPPHRPPVRPRGLHGHLRDLMLEQPPAHRQQVVEKRREGPHLLGAAPVLPRGAHTRHHRLLVDVERPRAFYDDFHLVLLHGIGYGAVPGSPNRQESDTRAHGNNWGFLAGSRRHAD